MNVCNNKNHSFYHVLRKDMGKNTLLSGVSHSLLYSNAINRKMETC